MTARIRDLYNEVSVGAGIAVTAVSSNTTTNGSIIDLQGSGGVLWVLTVSGRTDGTYTPSIQVGNDSGLSDAATADSSTVNGDLTAITANGLTYYSLKATTYRYARLRVASTSVTSGATIGASAIKYDLDQVGGV